MLSDGEWGAIIREARESAPRVVEVCEYREKPRENSFASPPLLACDDGGEYWVKFRRRSDGCEGTRRTHHLGGMVTEQVVGRLAIQLGAEAVPEVRVVHISEEMIANEKRLDSGCPGLAHGSRNIATNCSSKRGFAQDNHHRHPINRPRLAHLAVLYGLTAASDHQVIFPLGGDPLIWSVDHGHFLPGGPNWRADQLTNASAARVDAHIVGSCGVTREELVQPIRRLHELTEREIAEAVAIPPDEWYFPESDRIALARYLSDRRSAILAAVA
jgi:hypothetical protein